VPAQWRKLILNLQNFLSNFYPKNACGQTAKDVHPNKDNNK
jgi:hypothetical protein